VGAVLLVSGLLAAYFAARETGARKALRWTDVTAEVGPARWARPTISVIRDRKKLGDVFRAATLPPHPRPPRIDFARRLAILIAVGPRSSTGYALRVESVTKRGDRIDVVVREETPSTGDHVAARLTFPFRVITLPAGDESVHVRYAGRS
jgi:hypothetical protein